VPADRTIRGNLEKNRDRYAFELDWDGHRVLVTRVDRDVRLVSADFREWQENFPLVARAVEKIGARRFVAEAWLCALDEKMRPSFELLRAGAEGTARPRVVLAFSDLLHVDGEDLRERPRSERRTRLVSLLEGASQPLVFSGALAGDLDAVRNSARALGATHVIASNEDEPYGAKIFRVPCTKKKPTVKEARTLSPRAVVTNATKVLYPRDSFTKQDLFDYYAAIADVMLPHLRDRPVVCQRWPDGIDEFAWYQHRVPPRAPDYLRAVFIDGNRRIVLENRDALLWMVNQAAITFHSWASRVGSLNEPDWMVLDLDPGESTTWAQTIEVALAVRRLLEMLELPTVPKTSGQKGLHVLVPIARGHDPKQVHEVARRISNVIARALPKLASVESAREKRGGRLYLDHMQNFVGKSLVAPYSLRAVDGGPVSTPLAWNEVNLKLDPRAFHLKSMRRRVDAVGDLAAPLLDGRAQLAPALEKLEG